MVIEYCSQERSYSTFYQSRMERELLGHITAQSIVMKPIERNIVHPFGHLLANDAISWTVLHVIKMNEDDTTSSSRIFVKVMMQDVTESMGLVTLGEHFVDPEIKALCAGMFPLDNPKTRGSLSITLRVSDLVPLLGTCSSISR